MLFMPGLLLCNQSSLQSATNHWRFDVHSLKSSDRKLLAHCAKRQETSPSDSLDQLSGNAAMGIAGNGTLKLLGLKSKDINM